MDSELLIALLVLWCGSTMSLIVFLRMWFSDDGEAFHPHSVDVEHRHPTFLVVNSKTVCKKDCAIKSVSAFVAPRGSSSSKHFTALCMMISIAGMMGSTRWYFVGDATYFEFLLAFFGFGALTLVAGFELDVAPDRFLEDKIMITGWLIQKLKMDKMLPFRLGPHNKEFREFIRNSPEIYHLYEEDRYLNIRKAQNLNIWNNEIYWQSAHMIGAISYVLLVPAAIILNDLAEEKVAWITGATFCVFCGMNYLTGNYVPVISYFRCWILTWNPFLREPHFMLKLQRSVEAYVEKHDPPPKRNGKAGTSKTSPSRSSSSSSARPRAHSGLSRRRTTGTDTADHSNGSKKNGHLNGWTTNLGVEVEVSSESHDEHVGSSRGMHSDATQTLGKRLRGMSAPINKHESAEIDRLSLDTVSLRYARSHPKQYLRIVNYWMVMTELIAMMTPCVAMGIQWITALCDGPPVLAIIELLWEGILCFQAGGIHCQMHTEQFAHCILKH